MEKSPISKIFDLTIPYIIFYLQMHTHPKMDLRTESYAEAMSVADGKVLVIVRKTIVP